MVPNIDKDPVVGYGLDGASSLFSSCEGDLFDSASFLLLGSQALNFLLLNVIRRKFHARKRESTRLHFDIPHVHCETLTHGNPLRHGILNIKVSFRSPGGQEMPLAKQSHLSYSTISLSRSRNTCIHKRTKSVNGDYERLFYLVSGLQVFQLSSRRGQVACSQGVVDGTDSLHFQASAAQLKPLDTDRHHFTYRVDLLEAIAARWLQPG
mmetsp:Transcript_5593/g.13651  ORF Transcript_5593/g.13651 Transcript_5593/m.13651 type:complete len:209 (+) Transcript_5593:376-1002(+)